MLSLLVASLLAAQVRAAPARVDVEALFRRQTTTVPDVGSTAWTALYPSAGSTPTNIPQIWLDQLNAVSSLLPSTSVNPVATITSAGFPTYPNGLKATDPSICHYTYGCTVSSDVLDAPNGKIGISQDDGPLPPGSRLYDFFGANNISATHFYIGGNVLSNPDIFLKAKALPKQHFAVHTWTHPYMTSLSNEAVVAELGWTMQILADSNGGRIPSWWRPPYGDVDNRVRAIAKEVFGLTTVIWNQDSEDWAIGSTTNEAAVKKSLAGFVDGSKSPGLIVLEHELNDGAVDAFITTWPLMVSQGWNMSNIPDLWNDPWYKNALTETSPITAGITLVSNTSASLLVASSSAPSSASVASSSVVASSSGSASKGSSTSQSASQVSASAAFASTTPSSAPLTGGASSIRAGMFGSTVGGCLFASIVLLAMI